MLDRLDPAVFSRPGTLQRSWRAGQTVFLDYGGPTLAVTVLTDFLVRIRLARAGAFAPRRSWAMTPPDESYPPSDYVMTEDDERITVTTGALAIAVTREGARVTIRERESGRIVVDDGPAGGPAWVTDGPAAWWTKVMPPDEHYYGFGERTGPLDKRGKRYTNWTINEYGDHGPGVDMMYQPVPWLLALNERGQSYGLFLNTTYRTVFDLTAVADHHYAFEFADGEVDYYLIHGPEPAQVVERFTDLTGRMPLPPRWALGYHQSRYSYYPEQMVRDLASEFRRRRIPADVIHLDIHYMDAYRVFTWAPDRFPNPRALLADLAALGFKVVTIIDPGVKVQPEGGYPVYTEGVERGYFIRERRAPDAPNYTGYVWPGRCVFPDFLRPEVRAWWGELHRGLVDDGVRGIWNDMNEPAIRDRPFDDPEGERIIPPDDLPLGSDDEPATHAEARNLYATLEDRATYEGLRRLRPTERPFILSRSGFAGVQRWAAIWTGDNSSYWEHLELSLPQLLNMGLSGTPFVGADIGGFRDNGGPELFVRWLQAGAFYPFARGHTALGTIQKEPWVWGEAVEALCRRAIERRYQYLPYLYTLFYLASRTGAPVWRPLFYHFPSDPLTHERQDEVLIGSALLLAPVVHPGQICREVYLPAGVWYDVRTGERHAGARHLLASARLDEDAPLYARGSAIVATGPVLQFTDERPLDHLTLDVYLDEQGNAGGLLYEDDGRSFDYERGDYALTHYRGHLDRTSGRVVVAATRQGDYTPVPRRVTLRVHGLGPLRQVELPEDAGAWRVEV